MAHEKLQQEHKYLQEDYNSQQQIANDIRVEATHLLEEIKNLSRKNEELETRHAQDLEKMAKLEQELKKEALTENKPQSFENVSIPIRSSTSPASPLRPFRIEAYQQAIDDLLNASRGETPTNVLIAMKAVVLACKDITEDAEIFEDRLYSTNPGHSILSELNDIKNELSQCLTTLMTATKAFAIGQTKDTFAIEQASSALSGCIGHIVRVLTKAASPVGKEIEELKVTLKIIHD